MNGTNTPFRQPAISGGYGSPLRDLLIVAAVIAAALTVIVIGRAVGRTDFAFYAVMFSLFASGGVLGVGRALKLQDWGRATANEFTHLEKIKSTARFLAATTASTTPARALIYGLVHSMRPGRRVETETHLAVMEAELMKIPGVIRLIGATLVQLGILGTALGAMESLSDLSAFAASTEVTAGPELFQDLLGPGSALGGLALAFASTAIGLGANIALRAVAGAIEAASQAYVNHVAELIASFVLPDLWIDEDEPDQDETRGVAA